MKVTLAVLTMLPLVLSAQVRVVAPDWTNLNAPYIEDPVPAQIAINDSGHAAVVNAPDPLPDNVVASIEQSRFNEKQYLGKVVGLTIVVRRALTEGRERLLMPDWAHPDNINQLRAAQKYSAKEVTRLERKAEYTEDEQIFASLLAYYTLSLAPDPAIASRRRAELISWFVRTEPESDLLGTTYAMINTKGDRLSDPAGFAEIGAQWQAAVTAHPENAYILDHAVRFLAIPDANSALRIINDAKHWNGRLRWAGRIYALRGIGATSVDLDTGSMNLDAAAADASSRRILLSSKSAAEVLSAMWTLDSSAFGDSDFCPELRAHAQALFPATQANCQSNTPAQKALVEPELVNKVPPRYPEAAKSSFIQGNVKFHALVDKTGKIVDLEFMSGPLVFYRSTREAVLQWHYTSKRLNGEPIEFVTDVVVHYSLSR
ncbi:MAG: hypothetical protein HOQ35_13430 [Acidobacteriaceae bacterium]|nr:hypothetical protein [Acidobacteriaceae bacterium]